MVFRLLDIHVQSVLSVYIQKIYFSLFSSRGNDIVTLNDVLDILDSDGEDSEGEVDIFLEPPDGNQSDGYSGSEDEGDKDADRLPPRVLQAPAQLRRQRNGDEVGDVDTPSNEEGEGIERRCRGRGGGVAGTHSTRTRKPVRKWKKAQSVPPRPTGIFPPPSYQTTRGKRANQLFQLFWTDELLDRVCRESNDYAVRENRPNPEIQREDMRTFLGILLLSGYAKVPNFKMYWESGKDARNEIVSSAMSRDRFLLIKRNLHFCSTPDASDKYWKLRPLISFLQDKFMEYFVPQRKVSHDEAMVKYFGRHCLKQAIRNKPIRFGFKAWCQNTPDGYLFAFDFYQGTSIAEKAEEHVAICGRSGASVLDLLAHMRDDLRHLPFHFHVDNYFTSLDLLDEMKKRGYDVTGTIRPNRVSGSPPLSAIDTFKKKARGYFETARTTDDSIYLTRWKDNSTVTLASTAVGDLPVGQVRRYSRIEKKSIHVNRPAVVKCYNEAMGGTDRMDQHVNHCRVSVGGKKWWWSLFTWLLDVSVQNSWRLHREAGGNQTLVQFRREIVCCILENAAALRPTSSTRTRRGVPGADILRYDNIGHIIIVAANRDRGICQECHHGKPTTKCVKCDVFLCFACFASYHEV